MNQIIATFIQYGNDASYCFADDSGKDWSAGYAYKRDAMKLYYDYPEFQEEMRKEAKGFLWSLELELRKGQ